jgi:hypothetical protein
MQNEVTQLISLGNSEKALSLLATRFPGETAILFNQLNDAKREYNLNIIDYSTHLTRSPQNQTRKRPPCIHFLQLGR